SSVAILRSILFTVRPPPTSPLFPYTTLFRSGPDHTVVRSRTRIPRNGGALPSARSAGTTAAARAAATAASTAASSASPRAGASRSEEHTSELQSLAYLVCRLLLEKKKKTAKPWGAAYRAASLPAPQWKRRSRQPNRSTLPG